MKQAFMLTTADNPFDPFTQFEKWFRYDHAMGYFTCEKIAQLAPQDEENLSPSENEMLRGWAITQLIDQGTVIGKWGATSQYVPVFEGEGVAW